MITAHHLVFGRKYGGIATVGNNSDRVYISYSTRSGNIVVDWGDGTSENYTTPKNRDFIINPTVFGEYKSHTYSSTIIRNIKLNIANGLSDIYSIDLTDAGSLGLNSVYILDFGNYIKQFTNLYSLRINLGNSTQTIKGDLSQIPDSLERIEVLTTLLQNNTDFYLNLSNFSIASQLKYFNSIDVVGSLKSFSNIYGDLSKLPLLINFFSLKDNLANTLTYTSGRTWASSFDTLDIGNAKLSTTDTDNLLIDIANSITTAIGSKIIRLANCYRTSASNSAVAYLQSLGYVITVAGVYQKILDLPLQNNFTDTTGINTMIAGGTSNLPTFTLEGGEYAATFNGSQSLKTNANFNLNSDKVSISFWLKTSQTANANILELSSSINSFTNTFVALINGSRSLNKFEFVDRNTSYLVANGNTIINNNTWNHIVVTYDRTLSAGASVKVYINNSLVTTILDNIDNNGVFANYPLFIGQRGGSSLGFNGQMKFLKIFNYPLSTTEITNLFNKTI